MIVIDTSVAIKLINTQERNSEKAAKLLSNHIEGEEEIIVPELLFIEAANTLTTKSQIKEAQIKEGIEFLYDANFVLYKLKEEDLIEASLLAKNHKTSVYDMLYAVIAKNKKIKLITADERFVKRVNLSYVKLLGD